MKMHVAGRWLVVVLAVAPIALPALGGVAAPLHRPGRPPVAETAVDSASLSDLPLAAQAQISAVLGRDQSSYHAVPQAGGFRVENSKHGLAAEFTPAAVRVRAGTASWELSLLGYGYSDAPSAATAVAPQAAANRVEYRRGDLTEWYLNGPLGLEQGFTLAKAPGKSTGAPLTLAFKLSGNLIASADATGKDAILSRADGTAALRYRGLTANDATGRELPSWLEVDGARLRLRVDDAGARYPLVVDPFIEQAKLTASDGAANDQSGFSVAVSGDTVVVGAPGDNGVLGFDQGAAYVFVMPASGWANATETAKLTASSGGFSLFGSSVAISGDTVAVGAPFADFRTPAGILILDQGAAYVFIKPAGGWANATTPTARLLASDGAASDHLGNSVAVSGDTVVAGANVDDVGVSSNQGSAYVFTRPATGWVNATQSAKLTSLDGAPGDNFGFSVAISGDTIVAGAPLDNIGANSDQGSAYVFVRPDLGWTDATETAKLTASDGADDRLGSSVAVSGDTVVAGAPLDRIGAILFQGSAYVFVRPDSGWASATETTKLTASDGVANALFGFSVAASGDTISAGATGDVVGGNGSQGSAYVFLRPASGWADAIERKLTASDGLAGDQLGFSVAVSGDTVVAGAWLDRVGANLQQGSAYVFSLVREISIDDVAVSEGNAGTTPAAFTVTLSEPSDGTVTVDFETADGTAGADSDYVAASGTVTFDARETSATVTIQVIGETLDEPDETFFVNLSNPANAVIVDGEGVGTIVNDEPLAPTGTQHDVGIAGGGFRTKGHISASRNGLGPFEVVIKLKNFGDASEDIFYAVSSSEAGTLGSSACSGIVFDVPPSTVVAVSGCIVTYLDADDPDPVLTLTVTHNDGDGGTDSNPANNSDSQAIVINP